MIDYYKLITRNHLNPYINNNENNNSGYLHGVYWHCSKSFASVNKKAGSQNIILK